MANYLSFLGKFWLDSKYKSNNVSQILHSEPKLEENWFLWKFDFIWTHRGNNILIKFAWFYYCSVPKNQSRDWYFLIGIIPIPGLWINRDFASPLISSFSITYELELIKHKFRATNKIIELKNAKKRKWYVDWLSKRRGRRSNIPPDWIHIPLPNWYLIMNQRIFSANLINYK